MSVSPSRPGGGTAAACAGADLDDLLGRLGISSYLAPSDPQLPEQHTPRIPLPPPPPIPLHSCLSSCKVACRRSDRATELRE